MRSTTLLSLASLVSVCLVASGYGCGGNSSSPGNDGGTGNETSSSSGGSSSGGSSSGSSSGGLPQGDASNDTGDGAMPCTLMPTGDLVLATKTQSVYGITSDNQVLIYDWAGLSLSVVPLAGGAATTIGPANSSQDVIAGSGSAVVLVTGAAQTGYGKLTVWTAANGAKAIGTKTLAGNPGTGALDVSSDGKYVLYTDNATATTADIYVAGTDGSNATKLVTGASVGATCNPVLYFAGDDAVVSYCTEQPDASTTFLATVAAISGPPTWQTTQTFANADGANFVAAHGGTSASSVAFVTSAGMQVEAIGGTTPTVIDANGTNGFFNNAGTSLIYFDKAGNVWTSAIATPAPGQLVAGPILGTLALSPDDKWLEFTKTQDQNTGLLDMYLVSTTASGADGGNAVTTLDGTSDGSNFGDAFTADGSHAIFFTAVNSSGTGNYQSLGLPPSGAAKSVTMTGWVGYATGAAKVAYTDNWVKAMGSFDGWADLHSVDLAGSASPSTIVTSADADFVVTKDKSKIVYSWHACPGAAEGVYSVAAP